MIYSQISQVPDFIQAQIAALGLGRAISAIAVKPSHRGGVAEVPGWLHPALAGALQSQGYESLYQHQVEAITAAIEGKDVVITTPTASGKSLAFQLPMLQAVAADRRSGQAFRSLYLAPTKALIVDQQDKLKGWMMNLSQAGEEVRAVTLTGDTTGDRALLFKPAPDVLLSNPDCINNLLHKQVYPQFAGLKLFLKQLRYVVLDEVQSYTGIFGCNVANLMRRIRLAVVRAGGTAEQVQFILASATIGSPQQLWQTLCGREPGHPFALISQNTAPFSGRTEVYTNGHGSGRAGVCRLVNALIGQGKTTILFVESRRLGRELLHLIRREQVRLGRPESAVAQFHGTLNSSKRRDIAGLIRTGKLKLIIATSAMEQGVDFPQIDVAVVWGYPGINQLGQRFGRAGRGRTPGLGIFIPNLLVSADQYYARRGRELAEAGPTSVLLNPDYLPRLRQHILAAAGESRIALRGELVEFFGTAGAKAAVALQQASKLEVRGGYLVADLKSAQSIPIRGQAINRVQLIEAETNDPIEEFSLTLAMREVHVGAIYAAHDEAGEFRKWQVMSLNLERGQAVAEPINSESAFSTRALKDLRVDLDETVGVQSRTIQFDASGTPAALILSLHWGQVTSSVIGYERLLTLTRVACFTEGCTAYNKPLPQRLGNCPHCDQPLQLSESSTEVNSQVMFLKPLSESYHAPVLVIGCDDATRDLLKQLAAQLKQKLYEKYQEIPHWHQDLLILPPVELGLHTLSHLLLNSLPMMSQGVAASDLIQTELGQSPRMLLFDEADLGTGSVEFVYEQFEHLLTPAYQLATDCSCDDGCPKCCHSGHCVVDNGAIYRPLGEAFLQAVLRSAQQAKAV